MGVCSPRLYLDASDGDDIGRDKLGRRYHSRQEYSAVVEVGRQQS